MQQFPTLENNELHVCSLCVIPYLQTTNKQGIYIYLMCFKNNLRSSIFVAATNSSDACIHLHVIRNSQVSAQKCSA